MEGQKGTSDKRGDFNWGNLLLNMLVTDTDTGRVAPSPDVLANFRSKFSDIIVNADIHRQGL